MTRAELEALATELDRWGTNIPAAIRGGMDPTFIVHQAMGFLAGIASALRARAHDSEGEK